MFTFNYWDKISHFSLDNLINLILTNKTIENIVVDEMLYDYILPEHTVILDFGCGVGRNLLAIANRHPNIKIIGYDNQIMLSRIEEYSIKKYNKKLSEYTNLELISDWNQCKMIKFDFVFATLVFQHISEEDINVYLNDLKSMTKKLLISGRRYNDELVNGINKNTWEIFEKNNLIPDDNRRIDGSNFEINGDPHEHFACLYTLNDNIEEDLLIGRGWHNLEGTDVSSWRWTSDISFININTSKYDYISFESYNCPQSANIKIYTKNKKSDFELKENLKIKADEKVSVKINIKDIVEIKIESSVFVPSNIDLNSDDNRKLGIRIGGFTLWKNDTSVVYSMSDLSYYKDDLNYKKISFLETATDKFFKFPKTKISSNLDNFTVLLTCHGDRLFFGQRAYQSVIDAGITNIVIVISGSNSEYINWAKQLIKKHTVVIINNEKNNNVCWIEGLKNVTTNWVTILHDDDIILPQIKNAINSLTENASFGVWKGSVENLLTKKVELDSTVDIDLKTGLYNVNLLKDFILKQGYSLSPIHGAFKTDKLIACLTEWENTHGTDKSFYERPTFVVGNDLYIWSYFLKYSNDLFLFFNEECVKCISHSTSATQIDISRLKKTNTNQSNFLDIYSKVKSLHISNNLKVGIIFYVHELNDGIKKCIENVNSFKLSKHNIPFVVYSDNNLNATNYVRFNKMEDMQAGLYRKCDKFAFWAFIEGIKIAKEKGWDYFFCYEWDCLVSKDYWFDTLWQEHLSWPYEPIITGTPAIRMPKQAIGNFFQGSLDYIYNYSKECNVSINIDHASPISIYTNGALTFYNTQKMCEFFQKELYTNIIDRSSHVDEVGPWDFGLGIRIYNKLKEDSFKRVGWLPSSYSGCGDFCYNEKQRVNMIETGLKIVMHQYKYE